MNLEGVIVFSNNDENGLKRDLYEQSKPGIIDISSVSPNWFTFIDHEWDALQKDFFEKPLDGLLVDLVLIFRKFCRLRGDIARP
ncbi:hypothetical protein [Paenibacillus borealis]|uniref:Uncharacterized protein n=1 Tax=Paenibacillus borealis TaxID=160799 RepID=A0A089MJG3_PAEBO|nr:hypothetical protein [Paenibacillus borealis]AIQ56714.1 hypothetical protein PBOR_07000 [Paenibacillus borealis]